MNIFESLKRGLKQAIAYENGQTTEARIGNRRYVAIDDNTCDYNDYDINVKVARDNYEAYQNSLKQRQQDIIKKWCKEIREASSRGEKLIFTDRFITDDDKNKILYLINGAGCACDFPPDATLEYFQHYFEERGFKVVKIIYSMENVCCLKIIWISSDDN